MRRRELILGMGGALGLGVTARAQQQAVPVIGFLHSAAAGQVADLLAAFHAGLKESGLIEGQNLAVEYRWAENDNKRLPALAAELVARKVEVIATAGGDRSAIAANHETATIPIVSVIGGDPVAEGQPRSPRRQPHRCRLSDRQPNRPSGSNCCWSSLPRQSSSHFW